MCAGPRPAPRTGRPGGGRPSRPPLSASPAVSAPLAWRARGTLRRVGASLRGWPPHCTTARRDEGTQGRRDEGDEARGDEGTQGCRDAGNEATGPQRNEAQWRAAGLQSARSFATSLASTWQAVSTPQSHGFAVRLWHRFPTGGNRRPRLTAREQRLPRNLVTPLLFMFRPGLSLLPGLAV